MADLTSNLPNSFQSPAIRDLYFDQPAINIGSHPDNDVVVSGNGVLPFHATLTVQNGVISILPLSSTADIHVEGQLVQGSSARVNNNQRMDIGEYTLFVEPGPTPGGIHLSMSRNSALPAGPLEISNTAEPSILVNVITQLTEVEVSLSAIYEFEVVNAGQIVAGFHISIQGVPADWVQITPRMVNLNERQRAIIRASITPPRKPTSTAGKHPINIVVTSPNYPTQRSVTPLELTILPYHEFIVSNLNPRQVYVRWRQHKGNVILPITNQGNGTAKLSVLALDEENGCTFDFVKGDEVRLTRQASLDVAPGDTCDLPIEVTPSKQPMIALRGRRYHYTATVQEMGQAITPQTVSGVVVNQPLLGWWAILLTTLLILMSIFLLVQPRINKFQVAAGKDVIELGDTTNLEWKVSPFATRLNISNVDKTITRSMDHITVAPGKSTTYELVSGNWISGMLGIDRKASLTVLVIPPSPNINVFDVDKTTVDKGEPVKIRWSVTKADKVLLTIDEVVYELPANQFSGEQSVILEKDSIVTLEAQNLSGSELRSYFVNVVPPNITVNKFIVWIKTSGQASAIINPKALADSADSLGTIHNASLLPVTVQQQKTALESDFPYKFVELVADPTSDSGYRVEFYMPDHELAKGEQVMLEWDIDGVKNLTIAPFVETLPAKGKQPFFPQESMNFVLTARSGELEKLFMLPVSVFDGEPPTAPKINFFKAVPTKLVGAGDVQFSWSISGDWTHVQLVRGDKTGEVIVADWLNPQGFKTVPVTASSTFLLKAWNGTLSTASPVDITVDPTLIKIGLNIVSVYTNATSFMLGQKVTVTVGLTNLPPDKPKPTGTVTVSDGFSICTINLPALSCDLTFNTPGDKKIIASYSGDSIYLQADSAAFPATGTIHVQSTQVDLLPVYFTLDTGARITDISDSNLELEMDKGLRIMVEVRPITFSIPDDTKSKVNVSICDQDEFEQIVEGSCQFIANATAEKFTTQTPAYERAQNLYYADIVIPRFLAPGKHLLLFNYFHETNAVEPTTFEQPNVKIGRVKFHLGADFCTDVDALTECVLGAEDPTDTNITMNFRSDVPANIASILPIPPASAFTFSGTGTGASAPTTTWSCAVQVVSGAYKLVCHVTGLDPDYNPWTVSYTFNNNLGEAYYTGAVTEAEVTNSFELNILQRTRVVFADKTDIKVGKIIQLTGAGGILSLQNIKGEPISGTLTLAETAGKNDETFACSSDTNCGQDTSTGIITINDSTVPSYVYFKRAGNIDLTSSYAAGTGGYSPSSGTKIYSVGKQDGITTGWFESDGTTGLRASFVVNSVLNVRLNLDIPDVNFNDQSLVGRKLVVKIIGESAVTNCSIGAPGTGETGEFQVTITNNASSPPAPVADFTISCASSDAALPYTADLELSFKNIGEDMTGNDLGFAAGTPTTRELEVVQNSTVALAASIIRMPTPGHTNMVITSPSKSINTFHVGEKYSVVFSVGTIYGYYNTWNATYSSVNAIVNDYLNKDNSVLIMLPYEVEQAIDWSQSTCGTQGNVKVKLNRFSDLTYQNYWDRTWDWWGVHWDYWYWGYAQFKLVNDPCYLVFKQEVTVNGNTTFSFTSHNGAYTTADTFANTTVAKQNLSMSISANPTSGYVGIPQTITINMASITNTDTSLPPIDPSVTTFDTQFSAVTDCGVISDKKINSTTQAQLTLTSSSECTSKSLTVNYTQNKYFNALLNQVYTINISKHTPTVSLESQSGTSWVAFPFNTTNNKANKTTDYKLRIKVIDGDGLSHTQVPDGTARVKATGGTYTIKDVNNATVTVDADGYYHLTLDAAGYAEFTINFSGSVSAIKLQYDYMGSTVFKASPSVLETVSFDVQ